MIGYVIMNFNSTNLCELTPSQQYHNCIVIKLRQYNQLLVKYNQQ